MKTRRHNGQLERCVSCGRRIEYAENGGTELPNHHCHSRHEQAVVAAHRLDADPEPRERSFTERLEEGFAMLGTHFELLAADDVFDSAVS